MLWQEGLGGNYLKGSGIGFDHISTEKAAGVNFAAGQVCKTPDMLCTCDGEKNNA
jgi:hypothetical protein